jgi:hypothetical protein
MKVRVRRELGKAEQTPLENEGLGEVEGAI